MLSTQLQNEASIVLEMWTSLCLRQYCKQFNHVTLHMWTRFYCSLHILHHLLMEILLLLVHICMQAMVFALLCVVWGLSRIRGSCMLLVDSVHFLAVGFQLQWRVWLVWAYLHHLYLDLQLKSLNWIKQYSIYHL